MQDEIRSVDETEADRSAPPDLPGPAGSEHEASDDDEPDFEAHGPIGMGPGQMGPATESPATD